MRKPFRITFPLLLCAAALACVKTGPVDPPADATAILALLKKLDVWYKEDGFIIQRALNPTPQWVVTRLGVNGGVKFDPTDDNIRKWTLKKLGDLEKTGLCTDRYLAVVKQRLGSGETMNPGILLTGHDWGDNLSGLLADRAFLDFLPLFSSEGANPVLLENDKLSARDIDEWHKRRIAFSDDATATYTLLYPEIGIGIEERQFAFFTIGFKKTGADWKMDDVSIKEDSEKNVLAFYGKASAWRKAPEAMSFR